MSWVFAVRVGISHIVHVVSILLVIINFGDRVFQSRDVNGAVCSGLFELDNNANGVNFCGAGSRVLTVDDRLMVFDCADAVDAAPGRDHKRRWSPEVASKSV